MKHQRDIAQHLAIGTLLILVCVFVALGLSLFVCKAYAESASRVNQVGVKSMLRCQFAPVITIDDWVVRRTDLIKSKVQYAYDTSGDSRKDVILVYRIEGIGSADGSNTVPVIHETPGVVMLDTTHDGYFDTVYVDMKGSGVCEDYHKITGESGAKLEVEI